MTTNRPANLNVFINRNRVVFGFGDDPEEIGEDVKPKVVEYLKSILAQRNELLDERDRVKGDPQEKKSWILKFNQFNAEVEAEAKRLQFGQ